VTGVRTRLDRSILLVAVTLLVKVLDFGLAKASVPGDLANHHLARDDTGRDDPRYRRLHVIGVVGAIGVRAHGHD